MGLLDRAAARLLDTFGLPAATPTRDAQSGFVDDPRKMDIIDPDAGFGGAQTLYNAASGAGSLRDASIFARWVAQRRLSRRELFALGRNALTARGLGLVGNTATREGWRVRIEDPRVQDPQDCAIKIAQYEKRLGIPGKAARASFRGRQYSNAIILLNVLDGRAWNEPVDVNNIASIRWAAVIDRRDFYVLKLASINSANFAQPEMYRITDINGVLEDGLRYGDDIADLYSILDATLKQSTGNNGVMDVHADRVLSFPTTDYYPLLEGMQDSLSAFFETTRGMQQWAREVSMRVYKLAQLGKKVFGVDAGKAYQRLRLIEMLKSSLNAYVIDRDNEEIEAAPAGGAGIDKAADPFMVWVATSFGVPITQFWGVSPGGFGTGDSERATWHDEVRAYQDQVLAAAPCLPKLHGYILAAADGCRLTTDVRRVIDFADLSPPDEETRSKLRSESIMDLNRAFESGAITRDEYRASLADLSDDLFPFTRTSEGELVTRDAPVGVFTGSLEIAKAAALGEIPVDTGQRLVAILAPSSFTEERAASVFDPIRAHRQSAPTPASPAPNAPASPALPDQEDATNEAAEVAAEIDAELTALFSQIDVPADAMTAQQVAEEITRIGQHVTPDQIKRRAKAGDFPVYPPDGFGSRPRFSLTEVKQALLRRHGMLPDEDSSEQPPVGSASDWSDASCCIVLRLPMHLARWVPYKAEDSSPPHVTVLYVGDVSDEQHAALRVLVEAIALHVAPFDVLLGGVAYFEPSERNGQRRIAYATIDAYALGALHASLRDALASAGIGGEHVDQASGFTPHVTLAYLAPGEEYDGPMPKGSWTADAIEVWRGDERRSIALSVLPQRVDDEHGLLARADALSLLGDFADALDYERDALDDFDEVAWLVSCRDLSEEAKAERIAEAFRKYHATVNMGAAELREWSKSPWSKKASLSSAPIERNLRLLETPREKWTLAHASSALRTVNFVSRMRGAEQGKPVKINGRKGPSKRDISLKNWAFDPKK